MDVHKARKLFVEKVSWGPSRIMFGDAIRAFDEVMVAMGYGDTPGQTTYSPVPDTAGLPLTMNNADELEVYVKEQSKLGKRVKKNEPEVMDLDEHQENADVLKKLGVK